MLDDRLLVVQLWDFLLLVEQEGLEDLRTHI